MIPALLSSYPHNMNTSSFLRTSSFMYHAGVSRSRAKKTRDPVSDPLVDRSTEYKENMPEHSADTSMDNSQTSAPLTESGDAGEVQSTQPVGKGGS
jgi:condensin complex subunit 1